MSASSQIEWTEHTWNPVPDFPRFEVTCEGRIRNANSKRELHPMSSSSGHLYVIHRDGRNGRSRKLFVHRAVLSAHVGPAPIGCEARHLNGVPADNRLENLAWGMRVENMADKRRHGTQTRGETSGTAKLTTTQVLAIRRRVAAGERLRSLGAEYGVSHTAIRRAANGTKWAHVEQPHVG